MSHPRALHAVLLSHEEKCEWFRRQIQERARVHPFQDERDLVVFLHAIRKSFREIYKRDVPGYFIRKLSEECGLETRIAPRTRLKMNFAFQLMDENENYRNNKADLARALEREFGDTTLHYIVDDIWDEWHDRNDHPAPKNNVDFYGQQSLFDE